MPDSSQAETEGKILDWTSVLMAKAGVCGFQKANEELTFAGVTEISPCKPTKKTPSLCVAVVLTSSCV